MEFPEWRRRDVAGRTALNEALWQDLEAAHLSLVGLAQSVQSGVAEGWPIPACCRSPLRCLALMVLRREGALGVRPSRLARLLGLPRPTLAHHLDVLEEAGLIQRSPRRLRDERRVSVRLTARGVAALALVQAAVERDRRGGTRR